MTISSKDVYIYVINWYMYPIDSALKMYFYKPLVNKPLANIFPCILSPLLFVFICVSCCYPNNWYQSELRDIHHDLKMESSKIGIEKFDGSDFSFNKLICK